MQGSHQDAAAIRARLLEQRAALVEDSKDAAGSRAPVQLDQTSVGRLSRMDAMQIQAMALAMEARRAEALRRIDQALARLDAGTYGECAVCGEEIAPKRLGLDPAVPTCLECAAGTGR
jgi:DnaK suppressor protein